MVTTIQVSDKLWETLNKMKQQGESFEEVIWRKFETKKSRGQEVKSSPLNNQINNKGGKI
jgi:predicted CopG family antitoxin